MTFKMDATVRNAMLDAIETQIGTLPHLKVWTGAAPANCGTADSGSLLANIALPSDWMANASGGAKAKSGTWDEASADGTGTAGYFRIYDSGGVCRAQGTVTATGGGGDMTVDNTSFAAGQDFTVTSFTITAGNVG